MTAAIPLQPTHECPVAGCRVRLPAHLLMCGRHWRMAPRLLRHELLGAWRAFQRWGSRPEVVERYLHVREAVLAAVNAEAAK